MTKISIDVDFNKDPEAILRDIQEKAKSEVAKREKKELITAHLETLHLKVNEAIGTSYGNANDLIRALAHCATPTLRDRILGVTSSGRRKTITMTQELYDGVKAGLKQGNLSKAQLARNLGVSTAQVRKVEKGGFDQKFGGGGTSPSADSSDGVASEQGSDVAAVEEPIPAVIEVDDATDSGGDSQESPPEEDARADALAGLFSDGLEPLPLPESFGSPEGDAAVDNDDDIAPLDTLPPVTEASSLPDVLTVEDFESTSDEEESSIPTSLPFDSSDADLPMPEGQTDAPESSLPSLDMVPPADVAAPSEDLAPPADEPASSGVDILKPSIQAKNKPTFKLGKGKLSQQVTRPPISRAGPSTEPPPA
ncbi:MAG: hypothetical protein CMI30_07520 [Opitutae bacterium]|nr:hypothetical protein [Opitutae bacterium]